MGAKATKLGSCNKHPTNCQDWNVNMCLISNFQDCNLGYIFLILSVGNMLYHAKKCTRKIVYKIQSTDHQRVKYRSQLFIRWIALSTG